MAFKRASRLFLGSLAFLGSLSATMKNGQDYCQEIHGFFADCLDTGVIQERVAKALDKFKMELRDAHEDYWAAIYEIKTTVLPKEMKPCLRFCMRQVQEAVVKDEIPAIQVSFAEVNKYWEQEIHQRCAYGQRIEQLEKEIKTLQTQNEQLLDQIIKLRENDND